MMDEGFEPINEDLDTKEYTIPDDNEIIEVTEEDYEEDLTSFEQDVVPTVEDEEEAESKKSKKEAKKSKKERINIKEKWDKLTKKQKILVITGGSILFLAIVFVVIFFVFIKDKNEKNPISKDKSVIIEKDNYRYENGTLILLDKDDKEIGKYVCKNKDVDKCHIAYSNDADDSFDGEKNVYEDNSVVKRNIPIINDKYAFIYDSKEKENGVVFYYNIADKKVEKKYNSAKYYNFNPKKYLIIENDVSSYGLFEITDEELNELIPFKYDYLGLNQKELSDYEYLVASNNSKNYIIDLNGKEISKGISYPIKSFNKNYIVVTDSSDKYTLVDYKNNKVFNNTYDFITLLEKFAVVISKKTSLDLLDFKETKLNQENITIPNEYYNKTNVYNSSNKLLETKESFWILNNDNTITVEYYKDASNVNSIVINAYEGIVSERYDYVSYYDGILYFYEDEGKTNLIGSYKCSNKNNIDSENASYSNCYLAKESNFSDNELSLNNKQLGYLPLVNKRFVFINDTMDVNNSNIVLYDLKDKKSLGAYYSVDAGLYDNRTSLGFQNDESFMIIGKSTRKNKFGVVKLSSNGVSSILGVEYNAIERIGDYLEVTKASGTYQLYNMNGANISSEFKSKIVNYNSDYLKVKENNSYSAFTFNGKELVKDKEYINLYSSYLITIDSSNKLHVYEYDNPSVEVGDGVQLVLSDHKSSYGISYSGGIYFVKVFAEDGTAETVTLPL